MATRRPPELIRRAIRDLRRRSEAEWTTARLAKVLGIHLATAYRRLNEIDDAADLVGALDGRSPGEGLD